MNLTKADRLDNFKNSLEISTGFCGLYTVVSVIDKTCSKKKKYDNDDDNINEFITGFILIHGHADNLKEKAEQHNFKIVNSIIVLWQENEDFMSSLINGHVLNQKCKDDLDKNKMCCISPSGNPATWNMFGAACVMYNVDITNKQGLNKECLVNFLILN